MTEINNDNLVNRLSAKDITGVDLTTRPVDPHTGLTEEEQPVNRLSAKDINLGNDSSVVYPGSVNKYEKILGEGKYYPNLDPMYNDLLMHERQSSTGMMANSIARFGIEVASTALQGVAYDSDLTLGTDLTEKTQQEFGNGLSRFAESFREKGQELFPIYADPYKIGKFDPGSMSWWAENAISLGSSIGMLAPALLMSAATGGVAGAIGLGKMASSIAFKGITTALWSRHAENLMEALGVHKEVYEEAIRKGMSPKDAKDLASMAAANTYKKQWALLAQDIPQYILLNKLGGVFKGGKAAEKVAMEELSSPVTKYLGYGVLNKKAKALMAIAKDQIGEAGEETYQFLVNEQSAIMARNAADPNHNVDHSIIDVLKANYDNGEMWTSAFWGAMGAGFMQASMHGMNYKVQNRVNEAQLDVVTKFGPSLKQSFSEYEAALKSGDPLLADQALPGFIASIAMKAKLTNTTAALKDMIQQMKDAPEGTSFDQFGVDPETQGRLKQDPAFYAKVEEGIDKIGKLYDTYLAENNKNNKIAKEDKEPKAQVMANTKFLLDSTRENVKNLEEAVEKSWSEISDVELLSHAGREAEMLKQRKLSKFRTFEMFTKRKDETSDTATPEEKKQIDVILSKLGLEIAQIDTELDRLIGNPKKNIPDSRTAEEIKNDKRIVLPQAEVDEFIKQSGRLNAANASISQLEDMMDELRTSTPLSTTVEKQVSDSLNSTEKTDKIDEDNTIHFEDEVEFEDSETNTVKRGKIVGIEEAEEGVETSTTTFVIKQEDGTTVVKAEDDLYKVKDVGALVDKTMETLTDEEASLLNVPQTEDSEDVAFSNMNKLSYSSWDNIIKEAVYRDLELAKALSDKKTSFKGAQAFYKINLKDTNTLNIIDTLLKTGVFSKPGLKIVINDEQRAILKKLKESKKKLTKKEIQILTDVGDSSYTSFIDGVPITIELNLNGVTYNKGLFLHGSKFVPNSNIPVRVKTKGATQEDRKKSIANYKRSEYAKNRTLRRDLVSVLLQGGEVRTDGITRSKGKPVNASKTILSSERNKNLADAFGISADKIKLAITKSNIVQPELTTLFLDANSPVPGTNRNMQGRGNIYAVLAEEGLNNETGLIKLNKASFDPGLANIILDAFFLVGQAKIGNRKSGKKFTNTEHKDVKLRGDIRSITADEILDLFLVHGAEMTEPLDFRFKKRYGEDASLARIMANKRLYLHVKNNRVILLYGNDKDNKPYSIDLNEKDVPVGMTDLSRNREHFVNWLVENKRMATHLSDSTIGQTGLKLSGDFLDGRQFSIKYRVQSADGKITTKEISRKNKETYSTFLIRNNIVQTDVSRNESGSLFRDPVVNLNLVDKNGRLKLKSAVKPLPIVIEAPIANPVTTADLTNKKDAEFSDTVTEKEIAKAPIVKKEAPYINKFADPNNRILRDFNTAEPISDETAATAITIVSAAIENAIAKKESLDTIYSLVNKILYDTYSSAFGKGARKNTNIEKYLHDRYTGKTKRTLQEEWDAAINKADPTSSTSTEATGIIIESAAENEEAVKEPVDQDLSKKKPRRSMDEIFNITNNIGQDNLPFARETEDTVYTAYSKEVREKEIRWAFEIVGIAEEDWQLKQRLTDLMYKGKKNFALYSHSAILLYEASEIGTVYHEAFHRVSLGYLTQGERNRFYRAAKSAYGLSKETTNREVEEILAEKFRSFMLSDGTKQTPGVVQKFFNWILKGIKSLFYGERRLSELEIDTLFKQIRNGKYRNSSILEVNKDSLGNTAYARTIIKGTVFDTLNTRKDFKTIITSLANTLRIQSKVEDLNDVDKLDYGVLIPYLETLRDDLKENAEYEGNSKEIRDRANSAYEMYDEILGEKDETDRYDTFSLVIRPAIDSFFLSLGIKQVGIMEEDYLGVDTDDIESVGRLGGDYLKASYEMNKRDTALPAIKYMIATLSAESEMVEDKATGELRRVPKINEVTNLYEPIDFKKVWSKAFNSLHHLDSIVEMINELKAISIEENYSPFAELAEKLEAASENTRMQFFGTLSCTQHDFINIGFRRSNAGYNFRLNRSAEASAKNDTIRQWANNFFTNEDIIRNITEQSAKYDAKGNPVFDKKGNQVADPKGQKFYSRGYIPAFFEEAEEKYSILANDITDAVKNKKKIGKLVEFIGRTQEFLADFGIDVDEATIRKIISNITGEEIENDLQRLSTWVGIDLARLFETSAAENAAKGNKVDRKKDTLFKVELVQSLAAAYIEVHPENKADMQIGPGDGDSSRKHKYNTFADHNNITQVVNWIKHKEGYIQDRISNMWTDSSKILNSMLPDDIDNAEQVAEAKRFQDAFKLVTYSYMKEEGADDKGRGYLNMTKREDYLIKFNLMMAEDLLPFPILAQRKTYFLMEGVSRFKDTIVGYDVKTKNLDFSEEVIDYFWDSYKSENKRVAAANELIKAYKAAKGDEKTDIKRKMIKNYHYSGQYNTKDANATKLIRFRGFNITNDFTPETKAKFVNKLKSTLNKRIVAELNYANSLNIISLDSETNEYIPGIINPSAIATYESEREEDTDYGVRATLGEYTINYVMSIMESEKIFMGDPALFGKNKNSGEVVEDLYKRYYGLGSTGRSYAETVSDDLNVSYNSATIATQAFEYKYLNELRKSHSNLWKEYFDKINKDDPENQAKADNLAKLNLAGYEEVDPTDGGAIISPSMFKAMLKREGAFTKKVQLAFESLMSGKELSAENKIKALGVVLNPQKTVYFGQHSENNIDRTVYDKMAMSVLFPALVKGTHLEEVLDRMELTGKYANVEGLEKIDVFNYDTVIKIGQTMSNELYANKNDRSELVDLNGLVTEPRYWRHLRKQQSTDSHEVASRQMVGTQVYKITSSNIIMDSPYGDFESGKDLLNALTKSRMTVSDIGKDKVESELGIRNGVINNQNLISMLRRDAIQSSKTDDFRSALKLDSEGNMYLELDAFPDRMWIYSRLMNLVTGNTIDLKLPGSQLIQVSDYGYSSKGLQTLEKEFKSELNFYQMNYNDTVMLDMECRIPVRVFKRMIPNYDKLTHDQRVAALPEKFRIMGYRIPTQGQNSVVNLTVVDYLPDAAGEIIHLPLEFTALTGSDFDVDKLFTMMKNYIRENGSLKEIKFLEGTEKKDIADRYDRKLRELLKIYGRDHTVFGKDALDLLTSAREEVEIISAEDRIRRKTILASREANVKELLKANDEVRNRALEEAILSDEKELDEINNKNSIDNFKTEVWDKQKELVLKKLIEANKIGTLEAFSELSIEEQNTSEANENRMFDIFQTVISDRKHFRNTTLPLGTLTNELKSKASKYILARSGGKITALEAFESETPSYQSETKFKFMTSTKGIGVFALSNANHALTQQAGLKMRTRFKYSDRLNKNGLIPLYLIEGVDLKYVTDWLSAMLDAHVDAVKDNYIAELNVNSATYSTTSLLLRLGFGISTFDFLAQPAIVALATAYYDMGGGKHTISEDEGYDASKTIEKAYKKVKLKLLKSLNEKIDEDDEDALNINLKERKLYIPFEELMKDDGLLMDGLNPSKNNTHDHRVRQLNFLESFMKIFKDAEKLNELVLNTRVDTKSFGSNPVEFRHFMNKLVTLEEHHLPEDKRTFVNLDKYISSTGEYVEGGTMLSPLLKNSILYLEKIFNDKSIIGSDGFSKMFWGIMDSIPGSEHFRMSVVNGMTNDLFGTIVSNFFSDPRFNVGMTREGLHKLFIDGEESIFATLSKVKSKKFKYYEELKDNKFLNMLQIDSKPLTSVENYITTPFMSASDTWENDDYIADFNEIITHKDPIVQQLGRQLYLYSFYSTGFKHRYYDFLRFIPTAVNKEINMINNITKELEPVRYNNFIRQMLSELNDPASVVEFYTKVKKDFFENNWYNWRYVTNVDNIVSDSNIVRDEDNNISHITVPFSRKSKYALGTNEDGDLVFPSYVNMKGNTSIAQYRVPSSATQVAEGDEMEYMSDAVETEESDIIGGNVALFKLVGVIKTINDDTTLREELPVYIPINKKGALSYSIFTNELGIDSEQSFIEYNNLIKQIPMEKRLASIKEQESAFKEIPFDKQQVTNKLLLSATQEAEVDYYDELHALMQEAKEAESKSSRVEVSNVKEQFKQQDVDKEDKTKDICKS